MEVPITVAVSTCDRPASLARCLNSVFAGSLPPTEVVVVDQSAGTASREVVEDLLARGAPIVYRRDDESGLGRSQNRAVSAATKPLVAVIDDDCVADVDWLRNLTSALAEADLVAGRVLPLESPVPDRVPVSSRTSVVARTFASDDHPWHVGSGNNFGFSRQWWERIGGCDERLGPGAPGRGAVDMDLFYRFLRAGARVRYEPASIVFHEQKAPAERLARRIPYGYGMGACAAIWWRRGDRRAVRMLRGWFGLRLGLLRTALVHLRLRSVYEELLVLAGTAMGLAYGMRVTAEDAPGSEEGA